MGVPISYLTSSILDTIALISIAVIVICQYRLLLKTMKSLQKLEEEIKRLREKGN
jgi:hypothetical protein